MYRLYRSDCEKAGFNPISLSHFNRLRPKKVFTLKNIPDKYCICDICKYHKMSKSALEKAGVQGIPSKHSAEMMNTMCSENVGQDQYAAYQCISHACDKCGAQKFKSELMSHNQHLDWNSTINWRHWGYKQREDTKNPCSKQKYMFRDECGQLHELLDMYIDQLEDMTLHTFHCNWNYAQYQELKSSLLNGELLQILDFAQNYLCVAQDAPQSLHWDHMQVVLHPIINHFINADGKLVCEEHIIISNDRRHDKYAVHAFEEVSLRSLKEHLDIKCIYQFCDNCAGQYKSFGPFQFISSSEIPITCSYFGARHGKSEADRAIGQLKQAIARDVKSRNVVIRNAEEFYTHCMQRKWKCQHCDTHCRKFFLVNDVDQSEKIEAVTTEGTLKLYQVRSTGHKLNIEV